MSDIVERLNEVPTQRAICGEAATEIALLRRVIALARQLIAARGESTDVPLQFQQHRFLATCNELGIDAEIDAVHQPQQKINAALRSRLTEAERIIGVAEYERDQKQRLLAEADALLRRTRTIVHVNGYVELVTEIDAHLSRKDEGERT